MPPVTYSDTVVWDTVAVLALFDAVNQVGIIDGSTKAQKVVFLAELAGKKRGKRVAHFRFLKHHFGPYSPILAHRVTELERTGVLTMRLSLSPRARYVLDYAKPFLDASTDASTALAVFQETAEQYGRLTGRELKELVYEMSVPVVGLHESVMRVKEIPSKTDILDPDKQPSLTAIQPFDNDALEEIAAELRMNPEVLNRDTPAFKRTVAEAIKRMSGD